MVKDSFALLISRHQEKMLPTLTADIRDDQMSLQPVAGVNHPAWILGHLLAVERKIATGVLGRQVKTELADNWWEIYGIGSVPKPDRSLYKSREFYLAGLAETCGQITAFIAAKSDSDMDLPNPDAQLSQLFPTIGMAVCVAITHRAYHTGQIATWRKLAGLPHAGM